MPKNKTNTSMGLCSLVFLSILFKVFLFVPVQGVVLEQKSTSLRGGAKLPIVQRADTTKPRVLLGIFTTDSEKEKSRRKLIRKTYLSMFSIFKDAGLDEDVVASDRICMLSELLTQEGPTRLQSCEVVYAFVMGGFETADETPSELMDENMLYIQETGEQEEEPDVLRLNIRENMNEGKTTTWFKYASTILPDDLGISIIAKVDTDAVVFPRHLLQELREGLDGISLESSAIYGGFREVSRGGDEDAYMQGGFYFLSKQLARDVTSSFCPREDIVQRVVNERGLERAEDREMGSLVRFCSNLNDPTSQTYKILVSENSAAHYRRYKDPTGFRVRWKEGLANEVAHARARYVYDKYASLKGCPPTPEAIVEESTWFDNTENVGDRAKERFLRLLEESCPSTVALTVKSI